MPSAPIPPKAKKKRWPWITAAVIFGLFIIFAIIGNLDKPPTRTAATSPSAAHVSTSAAATTTTAARTATSTATSIATTARVTTAAAPPPAAPVPAATGMSPQQIADFTYVAVLDENHVRYASPEGAIATAHTICNALQAGNTVTAIGQTIVNTGQYSYQDAGTIVGAAESAYCPGDWPQ